jgi:hypothetical protein
MSKRTKVQEISRARLIHSTVLFRDGEEIKRRDAKTRLERYAEEELAFPDYGCRVVHEKAEIDDSYSESESDRPVAVVPIRACNHMEESISPRGERRSPSDSPKLRITNKNFLIPGDIPSRPHTRGHTAIKPPVPIKEVSSMTYLEKEVKKEESPKIIKRPRRVFTSATLPKQQPLEDADVAGKKKRPISSK